MDPDLALILSFSLLVTIVVGLAINGVVQKVLDYKRSQNTAHQSPAQIGDLSERTSLIEDRLMVLERIATDPEARRGADLAKEIEQLRLEQENTQ